MTSWQPPQMTLETCALARQQLCARALACSRSAAGASLAALIRMWLARRSSFAARRVRFSLVSTQVIFVHTDARAHAVQIENDIFHGSLLLLLETLGVGLLEGLDIRVGRVDLLRVVGGIEASHLNFTALVERIERQLGGSVVANAVLITPPITWLTDNSRRTFASNPSGVRPWHRPMNDRLRYRASRRDASTRRWLGYLEGHGPDGRRW